MWVRQKVTLMHVVKSLLKLAELCQMQGKTKGKAKFNGVNELGQPRECFSYNALDFNAAGSFDS